MGDDAFLCHEMLLVGGKEPIVIGAQCELAPQVMLATGTHEEGDMSSAAGPGVSKPVIIGDGVWTGTNVTLIAGSTVGTGSIVAAGSLVNREDPAGVIAGGVPCVVLPNPFPGNIRTERNCACGSNSRSQLR